MMATLANRLTIAFLSIVHCLSAVDGSDEVQVVFLQPCNTSLSRDSAAVLQSLSDLTLPIIIERKRFKSAPLHQPPLSAGMSFVVVALRSGSAGSAGNTNKRGVAVRRNDMK